MRPLLLILALCVPMLAAHANQTRVAPLNLEDWEASLRERVPEIYHQRNIMRVPAQHPALLSNWLDFASHFSSGDSVLEPVARELIILRTAYLKQARYPWAQHVPIAQSFGVPEATFTQIKRGPWHRQWNKRERTMLRAVDELVRSSTLTDSTWRDLRREFSEKEVIELVFLTGQYGLISMVTRALGIEVESADMADFIDFP